MSSSDNLSLGAVIVGFHPNLQRLDKIIESLHSAGIFVGVYKNSTFEVEADIVLGSGSNIGIASAQNALVSEFLLRDIEFVITLDQDTVISVDGVLDLHKSLLALNRLDARIIGVVPALRNEREGYIYQEEKALGYIADGIENMREVTSSGFLYFASCFKRHGQYMEELFIDYVDYEYSWRLRKSGFLVVRNNQIIFDHNLGEGDVKLFGMSISVPSPVRQYYQIRNMFTLWDKNYVPSSWRIRQTLNLVLRLIYWLIFSAKRRQYLRNIYYGFKDGVQILKNE